MQNETKIHNNLKHKNEGIIKTTIYRTTDWIALIENNYYN